MKRRFLLPALAFGVATLGGAVAGPAYSDSPQPLQKSVRVGFVGTTSAATANRGVPAFWRRLQELGWVEGQNMIVEARWAGGRMETLPTLMVEVLGRNLDVLVTYGTPAAVAAKNASSTVPIVVAGMADPVGAGLMESLARPGANLTGLSVGYAQGLTGKWLELLQEIVPRLSSAAVIANLNSPLVKTVQGDLESAAQKRHLKLLLLDVHRADELDRAFEQAGRKAQAVLLFGEGVTVQNRQHIAALAVKHKLPSIYPMQEFAEAGGLISYGPDLVGVFQRAAEYVDKILRGAKPGDLPVEQPTRYTLAINLKTAKALGLTIPESILLRADEVIR